MSTKELIEQLREGREDLNALAADELERLSVKLNGAQRLLEKSGEVRRGRYR